MRISRSIQLIVTSVSAIALSGCGTSVFASRQSNPAIVDPVTTKSFPWVRGYDISTVTTDASRASTIIVGADKRYQTNDKDQRVYFCRQATPDVGLEIVDAFKAAFAANSNTGAAAPAPAPEEDDASAAGGNEEPATPSVAPGVNNSIGGNAEILKVFASEAFELQTPTSIRFLESAKEGLCELYLNHGGKIDPVQSHRMYQDILAKTYELALAEIENPKKPETRDSERGTPAQRLSEGQKLLGAVASEATSNTGNPAPKKESAED